MLVTKGANRDAPAGRLVGIREPFNSVSHMVGGGLAIAAVPILVLMGVHKGALAIVSVSVYGATLVAVFTMSSLYHALTPPRAVQWLFRLDQSTIYLLIAGTYTPVALLLVGGAVGWTLFSIQWGLAITGITLLLTVPRTPQWIHQSAYIALGWAAVLALPNLLRIHPLGIGLLLLGGVAYTGGSYLYNRNRTGNWIIDDHGVWHLLVIVGAAAHVTFTMLYVL